MGGQSNPNSTSEEFETLTKVQKKDKKNIISEIIKKSIPNLRPTLTEKQWSPNILDSRSTSRHQDTDKKNNKKIEIKTKKKPPPLNHITKPAIKFKAKKETKRGQGLISTKWKKLYFRTNLNLRNIHTC